MIIVDFLLIKAMILFKDIQKDFKYILMAIEKSEGYTSPRFFIHKYRIE